MKQVTLDWETYVNELNNQHQTGYSNGAIYAIKCMRAGEPYPEDIQKVIEELDKQAV